MWALVGHYSPLHFRIDWRVELNMLAKEHHFTSLANNRRRYAINQRLAAARWITQFNFPGGKLLHTR
jgi:hypothetical protein